ncbi:hypothetical protein CP532_6175 [Ophiocordyceps camponoti-leonardi (nom. inval.)]|nr:hypothetical protein CP532_6175 [Ophiocordyceps camponoti-leonardi (nom. inval.)]
MRTSLVLLVASALARQASANLLMKAELAKDFVRAKYERKPALDKVNVCSPQQKQGPEGNPHAAVQENGHALSRRTLALHLQGDTGKLLGEAPVFSRGDEGDGVSIKEVEVMCDSAGILTTTFVQPGDVKCSSFSSQCEDDRFTIVNTACSGAVRVIFEYNRNYQLPSKQVFGLKKPSRLINKALDKFGVDYMKLYRIVWDCEKTQQQIPQPHPDQTFIVPTHEVIGSSETDVVVDEKFVVREDGAASIDGSGNPAGQPAGDAFFPSWLPSCINTCIVELGLKCQNNLDVACFCPHKEFAPRLYSCLNANRGSEQDFVKAKEVYGGMCISHIPKNPGIVNDASSFLGSMAIQPTPCFASSDYTTVVVPTTQIEGQGFVITATETISIPQIVLPTIVPGPGWFGGQSGGDGVKEPLGKPQPGSEEHKPVMTALEQQKPTPATEGHKPVMTALEQQKPTPAAEGHKPVMTALEQQKPTPAAEGHKPVMTALEQQKPTPAAEGHKPVMTALEQQKPTPATEGHKPVMTALEHQPAPGPEGQKPQPGAEPKKPEYVPGESKPDSTPEEQKPQPGAEPKKPESGPGEHEPESGSGDYKPQPGTEQYQPKPSPEEKKPESGAEEKEPESGAEPKKPESGAEQNKPQSGCQTSACAQNQPKSSPEEERPQSETEEYKPQSGCRTSACANNLNRPKAPEPQPGPNPVSPQTFNTAADKGEPSDSPDSYEPGTGPSPKSPQHSEPAKDKGKSPGSPESYEPGPGPNPSSPQPSKPDTDKEESPGSPEPYEAGSEPRKTIIKLEEKKPGKQRAACIPRPKGQTDSKPQASKPEGKPSEPGHGSPKVPSAGEAPSKDAPSKDAPWKNAPSKNAPSKNAPLTPSAGKPYSSEPAGSRSVPSAGGPKSPAAPGYGDKEAGPGSPKTDKKGAQQPGPKDKVVAPSKSSPNFNGTASKSTFGSLAVQTGGYAAPKFGNATVNGASRAGLGLFAVVAAIAAL